MRNPGSRFQALSTVRSGKNDKFQGQVKERSVGSIGMNIRKVGPNL